LRRLVLGSGTGLATDRPVWSPEGAWRALERVFVAEQHRWALWLPVALMVGIGTYFALDFEPDGPMATEVGGAAVIAAIMSRFDWHSFARTALAFLAAACVGFTAAKIRTELVAAPIVSHRIGPTTIEGRVEIVEVREKGLRITLGDLKGERFGDAVPAHVRVTIKKQTKVLAPGDWVHVTAVLMPPPSPAGPGDYDFGRRAYFEGLGGVGFTYGEAKPVPSLHKASLFEGWNAGLERLRNAMTARIRAVLPGSDGAIAAALITGDRSGVDPSDTQAYRDSGLTHVLSISGLHLALAGGIFFWVIRAVLALFPAIALNYPIKKWAAVAALAGAGFYLLISGCEAPAVRSYIMLAMMFAAILVDRPAITMRSVALAAGLILLFSPESLIAPGFEMSFAAVAALVAYGEWEASRPREDDDSGPPSLFRRAWRYLLGIAIASIVAGFATAPFAIFHFDRSAQYGILSNLLSMPIAGFVIMPAATAAMVLMPLGLERLPLLVMGKGVAMMSAVAHWTASLPGAAAVLPAWPLIALLLVVAGGLWIALWRKAWRWLGLVPIAAGIVTALLAQPPDILIGRDGTTVAVRLPNGLLGFVIPPKDKFAAEAWLKRDGDERSPDVATARRQDGVLCDASGCTAKLKTRQGIAISLRAESLAEDCGRAQIVVSTTPAHEICKGPKLVIDRTDVRQNGAYAVWLSGTDLRVVTVQNERGDRPWSQPPRALVRRKDQ
jgi:competence protein ComEC